MLFSSNSQDSSHPIMGPVLSSGYQPQITEVILYPYLTQSEVSNPWILSPAFGMGVQKKTPEGTVSETDLRVVEQIGSCVKSLFASRNPPRQDWLNGWSAALLQAGTCVYEQIPCSTGLTAQDIAALPTGLGSDTVFRLSVRWSLWPAMFAQPSTSSHSQGWPGGSILSPALPPIHTSLGEPTVHLCRLADPEETATFLSSHDRQQKLAASGVRALRSSAGSIFLNRPVFRP